MWARRLTTAVAAIAAIALAVPVGAAGASTHLVSGTLTGPGGFRMEACAGVISVIGNGTYTSKELGQGTYVFDVCVTSVGPLTFDGTVTFTRRSGDTLTGTVDGTMPAAPEPNFVATITGGTKRYVHARGELDIGPLIETDRHNCIAGDLCLDWTDTGPISGRLTDVGRK